MNTKLKFVKTEKFVFLTSLILSMTIIPGFGQPTAPNSTFSPEEILKILDEADTVSERKKARELLSQIEIGDKTLLEKFYKRTGIDARKRFPVFEKLIEISPPDQRYEMLMSAFKMDNDPFFREACAYYFKKAYDEKLIQTTSFKEELWKAVNDPNEDEFVQVASARTLLLLGDKRGKERSLQAILKGESSADLAITAFVMLKSKDIIPTLKDNLKKSTDVHAQQVSEEAVWRIELSGKSEKDKIPYLENAIRKSKFSSNQRWAASKLAEMNNDEAGEALTRLWKSNDPSCRDAGSAGIMSGFEKGIWSREKIESWRTKIK